MSLMLLLLFSLMRHVDIIVKLLYIRC